MDLKNYFHKIDKEFLESKKYEDEAFLYQAQDILVQNSWELPIVIQFPASKVEYEFRSNPEDISFCIVFVAAPLEGQTADDLETEVVEEMVRLQAPQDSPIKGSFTLPCEGVVFFIWDNTYDWSSVKKISYTIRVNEPTFSSIDQSRANLSLAELKKTSIILDDSTRELEDVEELHQHTVDSIGFLEDQIAKLKIKLANKKMEQTDLLDDIDTCSYIIHQNNEAKNGICLRMLTRSSLQHIISFLDPKSEYYLVCKKWNEIYKSLKEKENYLPKYGKMDKRDKKRLLFELYHYSKLNKEKKLSSDQVVTPTVTTHSLNINTSSTGITSSSSKKRPSITQDSISKSNITSPYLSQYYDAVISDSESPINSPINKIKQTVVNKENPTHNEAVNDKSIIINTDIPLNHVDSQSITTPIHNITKESSIKRKIDIKDLRYLIPDLQESPQYEESPQSLDPSTVPSNPTPLSPISISKQRNERMLKYVAKLKTEKDFMQAIDYSNELSDRIDSLLIEKNKLKKVIKEWTASYEKTHQRTPTVTDYSGHINKLYEDYKKINVKSHSLKFKLTRTLEKIGITLEQFNQLRNEKEQLDTTSETIETSPN